ncbi:hypothetical protein DVT68_07395 [Dyella solisilvae]|uniref:Uncharacterized protein n=1 Tax=Dyella solisilvae TaxID=1920168 RepID=A0A370K6V3_9GAMM|nr:hypothetical protein [Dyella solisilvae]RDI98362.1 hypothetical protein DVT68_07395 [Dyella solisilvae]
MQTLKVFVSLPDETHPDMELRLSANDGACDVVIAVPVQSRSPEAAPQMAPAPRSEQDEYVLGGYAGI